MKIKLPRKRKKAYLKKHTYADYVANTIIAEILYEENPVNKNTKYPELVIIERKVVTLFYW
jgi:hypothetical protein